jgi:nucleotide-binding universal stress UspA family protein
MSMFSKIVVAVDGGDLTMKVTAYAVRLGWRAQLHFVCALDPDQFFSDATAGVFDAANEHAAAIAAAQAVVDRCVATANEAGVTADGHVVEQPPVDAILDTAEKIGADLIVMASHGRSGLTRVVLGSVAEAVARRAGVAVLFVPTREVAGAVTAITGQAGKRTV